MVCVFGFFLFFFVFLWFLEWSFEAPLTVFEARYRKRMVSQPVFFFVFFSMNFEVFACFSVTKQAGTLTRNDFYTYLYSRNPQDRLDALKACITLAFFYTAARCVELWRLKGGDVVIKRNGSVHMHLRNRKNYSLFFKTEEKRFGTSFGFFGF